MGYPRDLRGHQDRTAPLLRQRAGGNCIDCRGWLGCGLCAPRRGGKSDGPAVLLSRRQNGGRAKESTRRLVPRALVFVDGNSSPTNQYIVSVICGQDGWLGSLLALVKSS